jgi:hypothetical protein
MKTDLFASMNHIPFLKNVDYEIHENLEGGELCADMGVWPVSKGRGEVVRGDLEKAWMLEPRFKIKTKVLPNNSLDDFRGILKAGGTQPWSNVEGLRNKYFTLYGRKQGAGFYTFTNKIDLVKYMNSDLWKNMSDQPHLKNLTHKVCEILEGGACCTDLGTWPQKK